MTVHHKLHSTLIGGVSQHNHNEIRSHHIISALLLWFDCMFYGAKHAPLWLGPRWTERRNHGSRRKCGRQHVIIVTFLLSFWHPLTPCEKAVQLRSQGLFTTELEFFGTRFGFKNTAGLLFYHITPALFLWFEYVSMARSTLLCGWVLGEPNVEIMGLEMWVTTCPNCDFLFTCWHPAKKRFSWGHKDSSQQNLRLFKESGNCSRINSAYTS
jgi:hypothetical protein